MAKVLKIRVVWIFVLTATAVFLGIRLNAILTGQKAKADTNPSTNIDSVNSYGWDDAGGWWDFHGTHAVMVRGTSLTGYASSSIGDISLDCATTRSGDICAGSSYGICNGPGPHNTDGTCPNGSASGILTGWGWNDAIGWVSFNCDQSTHGGSDDCSSPGYRVAIDSFSGDFTGYGWNDIVGWVSFNGANYRVNTSWRGSAVAGELDSSIIDTKEQDGVTLQSIIWQGSQPGGTSLDFQIAACNWSDGKTNPPDCNDSSVWIFKGPEGSITDYYGNQCPIPGSLSPGAGPDKPICVNANLFNGFRYFRYRVRLISDYTQTKTPTVDDVILNWNR